MRTEFLILLFIMISLVEAVSANCPKVITLAKNLNMNLVRPSIWSQLQFDCCSASGVSCDATPSVVSINWNTLGLNGTLNSSSLPPNLIWLYLNSNLITGAIPTTWPTGIQTLYLHGNLFTGSIIALPPNVVTVWLQRNLLTGTLPNNLPASLNELHLDDNHLSGNLPDFPAGISYLYLGWYTETIHNQFSGTLRLNRPKGFEINFNLITDIVVTDRSLLAGCNLSDNPLLGNPNLANFAVCIQNNLYSPSSLPNTKMSSIFTTSKMSASSTSKTTTKTLMTTSSSTSATTPKLFTSTSSSTSTINGVQSFISSQSTSDASSTVSLTTDLASSTDIKLETLFSSNTVAVFVTNFALISQNTLTTIRNSTLNVFTENRVSYASISPIKMPFFELTLTKFFKLVVNVILVNYVFSKSPFLREIRAKYNIRGSSDRLRLSGF